MNQKKLFPYLNKCCLMLAGLLIFSGCSTTSKKDEIVDIQRRRIVKLEKAIKRKNKVINQLKVNKWVKQPVKTPEAIAFKPMMAQLKAKDWVGALKTSARLRKDYPKSSKLAAIRYSIFKKMGLIRQANSERMRLLQLRAKNSGKSIKK